MRNDGRHLACTVTDDGVGLPEGFDFEAATGLGLSIVRTLVTSALMGTITLERGPGPADRPGTVVELVIPVSRAE
jgi:two-component sensor histidine kinase